MGFQRRDVLIGGVASAATATLAFIDRAKAAGDPEVKKLVLGFGIDPPFAIYITAIEKGWFRELRFHRRNGEELHIRQFGGRGARCG